MFANHPYGIRVGAAIEQAEFPSYPTDLYDPIRYILSMTGKRIRPILVLMGAKLFGKTELDEVLPASVAIEYFHNFSLIHDDIMDRAPLRRGKPTVQHKWNDNVAILSGDALLVKAYQELAKCPPRKIPDLLSVFSKVALEVCEGQQLDMDFEQRSRVAEAEYIEMIRLKTSVLLGGALQMGAILAEAAPDQQQLIYEFGVAIGVAFQLQDDFLDVFGDPSTFGKQIGGDILSNKKTILAIRAQATADGEDRQELQRLIASAGIDEKEKIERMKALYCRLAVDKHAERLKAEYMDLAYSKLDEIEVQDAAKSELRNLANTLLNRIR